MLSGPDEKVALDFLTFIVSAHDLSIEQFKTVEHKLRDGDQERFFRLTIRWLFSGKRSLCDRKGEHVEFRHPLTRDVTYHSLSSPDRVAMHRALGLHLGKTALGRGISAAIVARHLARGDSAAEAANYYLEAANAARNGNQTQLAVRYFNRALACLPASDARRIQAHEALETIFRVLGRRRDRMRHLEALRVMARKAATPRSSCLAFLRIARFDLDEGRLARGGTAPERHRR